MCALLSSIEDVRTNGKQISCWTGAAAAVRRPLRCVCSAKGGELQELSRLFSAKFDGLLAPL